MAGNFQPLDRKWPIVDLRTGTPTDYFTRWAQQRQIDLGTAITEQDLIDYLETNHLSNVQEILDQLSTIQGVILFRGAGGWAALAPGTAGQFLKTNGAGADPAWAASGGGSWALTYSNAAITNPTTNIDIDVSAYSDVMVIGRNITLASSGYRGVYCSTNGGSTFYNTNGDYVTPSTTGTESDVFVALNHGTAATAARDCGGIIFGVNVAGAPKWCQNAMDSMGSRFFVADNAHAVDHIRVAGRAASGGALINMTGGELYVLGR